MEQNLRDEMRTDSDIIIFSDGASKGNPGPGGWGAVIVVGKEVEELGGHEQYTTNNKMELTAVLEALRYLKDVPGTISVFTDSKYVISGITEWIEGWKKRDWMTLQKEAVQNRNLWEALSMLLDVRAEKVAWNYVGGHVGIAGNERVDAIASGFARGEKPDLYTGPIEGYGVNVLDLSHSRIKKERKAGAKKRSTAKAYSYVSAVDGEVRVHKTWKECEARVKGIPGAKYKKALTKGEEEGLVGEWSS